MKIKSVRQRGVGMLVTISCLVVLVAAMSAVVMAVKSEADYTRQMRDDAQAIAAADAVLAIWQESIQAGESNEKERLAVALTLPGLAADDLHIFTDVTHEKYVVVYRDKQGKRISHPEEELVYIVKLKYRQSPWVQRSQVVRRELPAENE